MEVKQLDKLIQKIFADSEKAELLEAISDKLTDATRVIIFFESRSPEQDDVSLFEYFQLGFRQEYEILGFIKWLEHVIIENEEEPE